MPHSLRAKLSGLRYKGILEDKDYKRLCHALDLEKAEQELKTGKWIKVKSGDKDFPESIVCSRCSNENSHLDFNENAELIGKVFVTSKFCPNCGAKMESEVNNG